MDLKRNSMILNIPLISICIPSYNRPESLKILLESIDGDESYIEIVISEDSAPQRKLVSQIVNEYIINSNYNVNYHENEQNLGYDGNLRKLIELAKGKFVLFMGDDDWFYPGALNLYITFLKENMNVGYVLRSYYSEHPTGRLEVFKYLPTPQKFDSGVNNLPFLFKRTVSIAGVTFNRELAHNLRTNIFDGTLLYQLYLVLEIAYKYDSVYCNIPVAIVAQSYRLDKPNFGASSSESKFVIGKVTPSNSINFTNGFFEISKYFDKKYKTNITSLIKKDLSKYSYPILSIQRKNGVINFIKYSIRLANETSINKTWHFYFYTFSLIIFGETVCDNLIDFIKKNLGYTPSL
jgi:glycosyltransferase involved in cell wall biosynthesis